jgi:hypothetical protein
MCALLIGMIMIIVVSGIIVFGVIITVWNLIDVLDKMAMFLDIIKIHKTYTQMSLKSSQCMRHRRK